MANAHLVKLLSELGVYGVVEIQAIVDMLLDIGVQQVQAGITIHVASLLQRAHRREPDTSLLGALRCAVGATIGDAPRVSSL